MYAVHRVVLDELRHALHDVVRRFRDGGVQIKAVAHGADPLGVSVGQIVFRQVGRHRGRTAQAVGIHPRFQREAAAVRLGDEDVQRIEARVLPLRARAEMAPRVEGAAVERVPKGAHLREDDIQPQRDAVIQQLGRTRPERGFGRKIQRRPFQIADPDGPPLARRQGGVGGCGRGSRLVFVDRRLRAALPEKCPGPADGRHQPRQKGPAAKAAGSVGTAMAGPTALGHASSSLPL